MPCCMLYGMLNTLAYTATAMLGIRYCMLDTNSDQYIDEGIKKKYILTYRIYSFIYLTNYSNRIVSIS